MENQDRFRHSLWCVTAPNFNYPRYPWQCEMIVYTKGSFSTKKPSLKTTSPKDILTIKKSPQFWMFG